LSDSARSNLVSIIKGLGDRQVRLTEAAVRFKRGQLEVLLVKKPLSQNWGIPKGKLEAHLSLPENAAKEAFEETGVKGALQEQALGSYRAMKRRGDHQIIIEVWVYLLEVTRVARKWPEKATRWLGGVRHPRQCVSCGSRF